LLHEVAHTNLDGTVNDVTLLSERLEDLVGNLGLRKVEVRGDLVLVLARKRTARLVENYVDGRWQEWCGWAEHGSEA